MAARSLFFLASVQISVLLCGCRCGADPAEVAGDAGVPVETDAGCLDSDCDPLGPDAGLEDAGSPAEDEDAGTPEEPPDAGVASVEPIVACELPGLIGPLSARYLWKQSGLPPYQQPQTTPIVIDVNADGIPDVVSVFFGQAPPTPGAQMRAMDGRTGAILWEGTDTDLNYEGGLAAGDLRGNGEITIVTVTADGRVVGHLASTGQRIWDSHDAAGTVLSFPQPIFFLPAPVIVNLDGTGPSEIVVGLRAYDDTGLLLWDHGQGGGSMMGTTVIAADLDGDGLPEVTDGTVCFNGDGSDCGWTGAGWAGLAAVGDFVDAMGCPGQDGRPELVVISSGTIVLVDGATGQLVGLPYSFGSLRGGPPLVADFDGDGMPEVGIAHFSSYIVAKLRPGVCPPKWHDLWRAPMQDSTSGSVSSAAFDFNGDGKAEVVLADEISLQVFNGPDGALLLSRPHCSGTSIEGPVVADVDGDGQGEIVFGSRLAAGYCPQGAIDGITVLHSAEEPWMPARKIWNQANYHVTNVCDGQDLVCGGPGAPGNLYAAIPPMEQPNWFFSNDPLIPVSRPLNNFRQNNLTARTAIRAPDLRPHDVAVDVSQCPESVILRAQVGNRGELPTAPGMSVVFIDHDSGTVLGAATVPGPIQPGEIVEVSTTWSPPSGQVWPVVVTVRADDDGVGTGSELECDETNNEAESIQVTCP